MVILLPYAQYEKSARVLDWARLYKQIELNLILMRSFAKVYAPRKQPGEHGFSHHTVGLFWTGHELHLAKFTVALTNEALTRPLAEKNKFASLTSRKSMHALWTDLLEELEIRGFPDIAPSLIGKSDFHSATRAYLKFKEQQSLTFRWWKTGRYPDHACHRNNLPRKASWTRDDFIRLWSYFSPPPLRWYNRWGWEEEPDDSRYYMTEDRIPQLERETERKRLHPMSPEALRSLGRGQRKAARRS